MGADCCAGLAASDWLPSTFPKRLPNSDLAKAIGATPLAHKLQLPRSLYQASDTELITNLNSRRESTAISRENCPSWHWHEMQVFLCLDSNTDIVLSGCLVQMCSDHSSVDLVPKRPARKLEALLPTCALSCVSLLCDDVRTNSAEIYPWPENLLHCTFELTRVAQTCLA